MNGRRIYSSCRQSGTTRAEGRVLSLRQRFGRMVTVRRSNETSDTSRPKTSLLRAPVSRNVASSACAKSAGRSRCVLSGGSVLALSRRSAAFGTSSQRASRRMPAVLSSMALTGEKPGGTRPSDWARRYRFDSALRAWRTVPALGCRPRAVGCAERWVTQACTSVTRMLPACPHQSCARATKARSRSTEGERPASSKPLRRGFGRSAFRFLDWASRGEWRNFPTHPYHPLPALSGSMVVGPNWATTLTGSVRCLDCNGLS
jgi:hypothetical protein